MQLEDRKFNRFFGSGGNMVVGVFAQWGVDFCKDFRFQVSF